MKENPFLPNRLVSVSPESFDEIGLLLEQSRGDAIVVVQQYGLAQGIDLAVWQLTDAGTVRKIVLATGPVQTSQRLKSFAHDDITEDKLIPRSVRIERCLADSELLSKSKWGSDHLKWLIDYSCYVDIAEFRKVKRIMESLAGDCESVLGSDSVVWVLFRYNGSLSCVSKSWGGQIDPEKYWNEIKTILELAGIYELPVRMG